MTNTRIYRIWKGIRTRCNNPNRPSYPNYGGRGIKMCKRWDEFINFYTDMQNGYNDTLTIERRNNNKGYELKNCYWITKAKQGRNTRRSKLNEFQVRIIRKLIELKTINGAEIGRIFDVRRALISDIKTGRI